MALDEIGESRFPPPGRTPREDTAAVMKFYRLPKAFPPAALEEARRIARGAIPAKGRLDLRKKFVFTCDPESARDFDDALSLETDRRGNRVLGVHIADVSHYVKPGSALDREAYRRGTSVYLCDRVVPMLPEELSNGVCSLVPGEDRLAFSVFMTFDRSGEMVRREFAKSVIRSRARFTYEQVMAVIRGGRASVAGVGPKELRTVRAIAALAMELRARRFAAGALDIEIPEAEVALDRDGELESITARPYDESHQMVEECMVAANEAVAKELWTRGIRILARLHEPPDPEKLLMLRAELKSIGVKAGNLGNQKVMAQFLASVKGHPLYPTIAMMVLRSMKRAVYDRPRQALLRPLHLAHPPLSRPHAPPPARGVAGEAGRQSAAEAAREVGRALERARGDRRRGGAGASGDQEVPPARRPALDAADPRLRRRRHQVRAVRMLCRDSRARGLGARPCLAPLPQVRALQRKRPDALGARRRQLARRRPDARPRGAGGLRRAAGGLRPRRPPGQVGENAMRRAFTLIELLTVVAIMATMVTVGVVSLSSSRGSTRVFAAVRDMMAMIRRARSVALVTQKPALVIYSNAMVGDEPSIKVEIKGERLFSSNESTREVRTLAGDLVPAPEPVDAEGGGETIEDVLSPESLSEEVGRGLRVKVLVGDKELVSSGEERARSRISIYSTADNVSRTLVAEDEKKAPEAPEGDGAEADGPVKVAFAANGTVDPAHRIWIYPDGSTPEKGYCIEVDRFGEPRCRELEGGER